VAPPRRGRRRLGGGAGRPVGEQPHARPRVAAALPAPEGADTGSAAASAARGTARAGARRRARGARRGRRRRAAVGGVPRHQRAGRPVGAPCDDAGDYPQPSPRGTPPSPRRGAHHPPMALPDPLGGAPVGCTTHSTRRPTRGPRSRGSTPPPPDRRRDGGSGQAACAAAAPANSVAFGSRGGGGIHGSCGRCDVGANQGLLNVSLFIESEYTPVALTCTQI